MSEDTKNTLVTALAAMCAHLLHSGVRRSTVRAAVMRTGVMFEADYDEIVDGVLVAVDNAAARKGVR